MEKAERPKAEFDPKRASSYGYWSCGNCKTEFNGGGPSVHLDACEVKDQGNETYMFGPKEVKRIMETGRSGLSPSFLNPQTLETFFPELLETI
jgi:hypothetical protein